MVIYFDLDDTLYRLYDPFYKAYQKVFHEDLDIYALWKQSRIYSNEIYPKYLNKLITKDELSIYRLKNAFKDCFFKTRPNIRRIYKIFAKLYKNKRKGILSFYAF